MIIVRLNGGLGNQMFQYALALVYMNQGKQVKIDRQKYQQFDEKRKCILDYPCFELMGDVCELEEIKKYSFGNSVFWRIWIRLFNDKDTHIIEKGDYEYDPNILKIENGYVDGFWQTWKYFDGIKNEIKHLFSYVNTLPDATKEYVELIQSKESVAVHVRRGDYLKFEKIYGNICTLDYYKKAFKLIGEKLDEPYYFVFSDDMDWVKNNLKLSERIIYVDSRWEDYIDMELMSMCKNMILANSSFSWWAAYLNKNESGFIIAPRKWVNYKDTPDIYCKGWVLIS